MVLARVGVAQYRAGQYEQAIENLEKSNASEWKPESTKALNWFLLAMAHHQLGHSKDAKKCLDTARRLVVEALPQKPGGRTAVNSADWIPLQVLSREAESLLKEPPALKPNTNTIGN